jgi:hypothetical protein
LAADGALKVRDVRGGIHEIRQVSAVRFEER